MYLFIPGRHQLITKFQYDYLLSLVNDPAAIKDIQGNAVENPAAIEAVIFPVTSANHSNTRRNPLPFYLRAISIEAMSAQFPVPVFIYGIDDVGQVPDFAEYTLKRVAHESDVSEGR